MTSTEQHHPVNTSPSLIGYEHLHFELYTFVEGNSNKFWEAALDGARLIIRFGRVGTKGQVQVKTFKDEEEAGKEKGKMVREKLGKGYTGS